MTIEQNPNTRASSASGASLDRAPGLWPAAAVMLLSGVITWGSLSSAMPGTENRQIPGTASELAQVEDQDLPAALGTMSGPASFLAQFKKNGSGCPLPLAWVAVARAPGQPGGSIRLQSGKYFSPIFEVQDFPMRIAVPYPEPYETGHGKLTVLDAGGNAVVSLTPPWRVSVGAGTHEVTWSTRNRCK